MDLQTFWFHSYFATLFYTPQEEYAHCTQHLSNGYYVGWVVQDNPNRKDFIVAKLAMSVAFWRIVVQFRVNYEKEWKLPTFFS